MTQPTGPDARPAPYGPPAAPQAPDAESPDALPPPPAYPAQAAQPAPQAYPPPTYYAPRYAVAPYYTPGVALPPPSSAPYVAPGESRRGVMLGAGLGLGSIIDAELRAGVMVSPHFMLFGTLGAGAQIGNGGASDVRIWTVGARAWLERAFFEARLGAGQPRTACDDFDSYCADDHFGASHFIVQLGVGFDLVHRDHVGLEIGLNDLIVDDTSQITATMGLNFYLF